MIQIQPNNIENMIQIKSKAIAGTIVNFVSAELIENIIEYKLFDAEKVEIGSGSLATDGTITDETVLENVLLYKVYDSEQVEFASGSLATDGTITEETAIENVLSSLGAVIYGEESNSSQPE